MRIRTVQSHGKSLNIEGESAEFTGTEQHPEVATSGRLTTNKLPGVGLQPPVLESEKRFLRNPTKCSLPRRSGCTSFLHLFKAPTWWRLPAWPLPARANNPAPEETPAAASKADVASARCAGSGRDKAAVDEGALGRRPLQESRGKDDRKERDAPHTEQASSASESLCAGAPDLAFLPEMMQHWGTRSVPEKTIHRLCRWQCSQRISDQNTPEPIQAQRASPGLPPCPPGSSISRCHLTPSTTTASGGTKDLMIARKK